MAYKIALIVFCGMWSIMSFADPEFSLYMRNAPSTSLGTQ